MKKSVDAERQKASGYCGDFEAGCREIQKNLPRARKKMCFFGAKVSKEQKNEEKFFFYPKNKKIPLTNGVCFGKITKV